MPTIVATPGSASANSYGTVVEAQAYFDARLNTSAWDEAIVAGTEEEALVAACYQMDRLDYIGDRATTTQALEWPRITNDFYDDYHDVDFPYTSTEIPTRIKNAQFEWALALLAAGDTTVAAGTVESLEIGGVVKAKYAAGSSGGSVSTDVTGVPDGAAKWLKGLRLYAVLA